MKTEAFLDAFQKLYLEARGDILPKKVQLETKKTFVERMINTFSFGGGVINDTLIHYGNGNLPFGGIGSSGYGNFHGKHGFETFSHQKAIIKRGNWIDPPFRYAPYKGKLKLIKTIFKWLS